MKTEVPILQVLLVEDDRDSMKLLMETLPKQVEGYQLEWEPCSLFSEAMDRIRNRRYDIVATDVYRDRKGLEKRNLSMEDAQGGSIVSCIQNTRFCPVVAFSDGPCPENVQTGTFVKFADKTNNDQIILAFTELIQTGVPQLAHKLHDELDKAAGSYLWEFLKNNWPRLAMDRDTNPVVLERLLRRRAAIQLGRLNPQAEVPSEVATVEAAEFYIWPAISGDELRLGEILRHKGTGEFRVVLTPHCFLTVEPGEERPRAEYVLTATTLPASDVILGSAKHPWKGNRDFQMDKLRRRIQSPADLGKPAGRYWFIPGFLDIPNLYCDFMRLESVGYDSIKNDYHRIAVLDAPFSEALQSCFSKFYSAVGLPGLNPERFQVLIRDEA